MNREREVKILITEGLSHVSNDIKELSTLIIKASETAENISVLESRITSLLSTRFQDIILMSIEDYGEEILVKLDTNAVIH